MIERIAELREEAEAAIAGATATGELEELRVRYLGRKAELPQILRGVGALPPEERGPTGKAANQARQALEALIERARRSAVGGRARARSWPTPSTSRCPARRRSRSAACTC